MKHRHALWIIATLLMLCTIALLLYRQQSLERSIKAIASFDECVAQGYPILKSYPARCQTPEGSVFVQQISPSEIIEEPLPNTYITARFDTETVMHIHKEYEFEDSLRITLQGINDSRCKPDVQCIWMGELAPVLAVTGGALKTSIHEVHLGTINTLTYNIAEYTITLVNATESDATLKITKHIQPTISKTSNEMGVLSGQVTIGPMCPVEQADRPCTTPPETYTSRSATIFKDDGVTVMTQMPLTPKGTYAFDLPAGTYWVQIEPAGIGEGEKRKVVLSSGIIARADFDIDTGIR